VFSLVPVAVAFNSNNSSDMDEYLRYRNEAATINEILEQQSPDLNLDDFDRAEINAGPNAYVPGRLKDNALTAVLIPPSISPEEMNTLVRLALARPNGGDVLFFTTLEARLELKPLLSQWNKHHRRAQIVVENAMFFDRDNRSNALVMQPKKAVEAQDLEKWFDVWVQRRAYSTYQIMAPAALPINLSGIDEKSLLYNAVIVLLRDGWAVSVPLLSLQKKLESKRQAAQAA
jgi:hypothetical protein